MGRGGDQVASVLAIYADDPSSNPAEAPPPFDLIHPLLFRLGTRVIILMTPSTCILESVNREKIRPLDYFNKM